MNKKLLIVSITLFMGLQTNPMIAQTNELSQEAQEQIINAIYLKQSALDLVQQGNAEEALKTYQEALAIFRQYEATGGEANTLLLIGDLYAKLGNYSEALNSFNQALTVYKADNSDIANQAYSWEYLGNTYHQMANLDQAVTAYQTAINILEKRIKIALPNEDTSSYKNSLQLTLQSLGEVYFKQNKYSEALPLYQKVLENYYDVLSPVEIVHIYNNMGVTYANMSQYGKARESYLKALETLNNYYQAVTVRYRGEEASILNNLSALLFSLGDIQESLEYADQALKVYQTWEPTGDAVSYLNSVSLLQDILGNSSINPAFLRQKLVMRASIGEEFSSNIAEVGQAYTLLNLGQIYLQKKDIDIAKDCYQKALALYRKFDKKTAIAITISNLGQVAEQENNLPLALSLYQQSLEIYKTLKDQSGIAISLTNIAHIYQTQGNQDKAMITYQESIALQRKLGDNITLSLTLKNVGEILLEQNKIKESIPVLQESMTLWEELRAGLDDASKVSLFEQATFTYQYLQKALVKNNQPELALEISERGRARAFAELLGEKATPQKSIAALKVADIQKIAQREKITFVEYSMIEGDNPQLYIWVIKPTGEITFKSTDVLPFLDNRFKSDSVSRSITRLVMVSRDSLLGDEVNKEKAYLKRLYKMLIQPIINDIGQNSEEKVVFIPQSALFLIPFPALISDQDQYLIQQITPLISPSIQVYNLTQELPISKSVRSIVVGNPKMPSYSDSTNQVILSLSPLEGAEKEAKSIAQLLQTTPLIGETATETTVRQLLPEANIIHLATHGLLNELKYIGGRLPGSIALAPDKENDGWLTAQEVFNLHLGADLVVLSACNTGGGWLTGDGVVGLSRAFLTAGSRSVIVSLWSVPDQPTSFLMEQFYQQLTQHQDKAVALRQAMLQTIQLYPDPANWAGFTLMGSYHNNSY